MLLCRSAHLGCLLIILRHQAARMVRDYLFNPKEFWTGAPVAALSRSCPWYTTTKYSSDIGCGWLDN